MVNKEKRIIYLDVINIIACIFVVALHCNFRVHNYSDTVGWKISLGIFTVCLCAVPLFLMITGTNLLGYREKYDTKKFLKKRVIKIVIPLIMWTGVIVSAKFIFFGWKIEDFTMLTFVNTILTNEHYTPYYYIYWILSTYLTIPIISGLAKIENKNTLIYTIIAMFIFDSILPVICDLAHICNPGIKINFIPYMIYIFIGYYISKYDISKKTRMIVYVLGILSCIFKYFYVYINMSNGKIVRDFLLSYTNFYIVLWSSAVFILLKNIEKIKVLKNEKITNIIRLISSCSFGIYLCHMFIMDLINKIFNINIFNFSITIVSTIIVYSITLIIVLVMKKTPIIKFMVP